jgi:hypothetical protein
MSLIHFAYMGFFASMRCRLRCQLLAPQSDDVRKESERTLVMLKSG